MERLVRAYKAANVNSYSLIIRQHALAVNLRTYTYFTAVDILRGCLQYRFSKLRNQRTRDYTIA